MDLLEQDLIHQDLNKHWYYRIKLELIRKLTRNVKYSNIADIGAGSGFFSKGLLSNSKAASASLIDINYPEEKQESINGKIIYYFKKASIEDSDLILMMDVLEHIEDDVTFLKNYFRQAKKGSYFLITVPAFQFLFSSHDHFLAHYRRYTLHGISDAAEKSGLTVIHKSYFYSVLFPIVALIRLIKKNSEKNNSEMKEHSALINTLLYLFHKFELLIPIRNRLFGLTAVLLCRKD
jgi:hypothetical protein